MAGGVQLCPPCVDMLTELCHIGKDARLCESLEGYMATGDARWVERASEAAAPGLLAQAKTNLLSRGVLPQGA